MQVGLRDVILAKKTCWDGLGDGTPTLKSESILIVGEYKWESSHTLGTCLKFLFLDKSNLVLTKISSDLVNGGGLFHVSSGAFLSVGGVLSL